MRTRRSPRNQEILFRSLFKSPEKIKAGIPVQIMCVYCLNFPNNGRMSGECTLIGERVSGWNKNRECFMERK
jgi:hypothetical protein